MMFTREFWLGDNGAVVRAVRTFAQSFIATVGVGQTNLFTADLKSVIALSSSAAVLSLLMSLDRREALLSPTPVKKFVAGSGDPAAADYQPDVFNSGCGGDPR